MKRKDVIKKIEASGCVLLRDGAKHSVFINPINNKISTLPCHNEINDFLFKKICKDLSI